MGIFNKLINAIFGKKNIPSKNAASASSSDGMSNYMDKWEQQRLKRISEAENSLKDWIISHVAEKGSLPFSWESGGDEAFVTFEHIEDDDDIYEEMYRYIIDKLNIPDAGEFEMNGKGEIYKDGNMLHVRYGSVIKYLVDYNEETGEEIYNEKEETDSGDMVLFPAS
jgi:hypothetical protein